MGAHYLQMQAVGSEPNNNPNNEQTENKGNIDPIRSDANRPLRRPQGHMGVLRVNAMRTVQSESSCSFCRLAGHETDWVTSQGMARLGNWLA